MGKSLEITHKQFIEIVAPAFIKANKALYLQGSPGVGKSDIVKTVAKREAKKQGLTFVEWNKLSDTEKHELCAGFKTGVSKQAAPVQQVNTNQSRPSQQELFQNTVVDSTSSKPAYVNPFAQRSAVTQPMNTLTQSKDRIEEVYIFADLRLSQKDSTDLGGMPSIDNVNNISRWCPPLLMKVLSDKRCNGLLFLDELPNAPVLVQNAAYSLVLDRAAGEITFSSGVAVFGAGNRVSDKSGVFERPQALKNRFGNYTLKQPSATDWIQDYASPSGLDTRVIGFISFKHDMLNFDGVAMTEDSINTPRSVADGARLIKGESDIETCRIILAGQCGEGWANTWADWATIGSNLNIPSILNGTVSVPTDMGARWFMVGALNDEVAKQYNAGNKTVIQNYCKVLNRIDSDLQVSAFCMIKEDLPRIVPDVLSCNEGKEIADKIGQLINFK